MNTENTASSSVSEISPNIYGSKPNQFSKIPNLYKLAEFYTDEDSGMTTDYLTHVLEKM